eukprot:symbB.v1.2.022618.t1/scaffold1976.1/size93997/5
MVFHAGVALKAGIKYQVVMLTQMHRTFYTNHEWQNLEGAVPSPAIQPEEALGEGSDLGDVGERPSVEACREVCAQLILCTVAIFRRGDRHCIVADLSRRAAPRETQVSAETVTLFLLERRSQFHVADLWSIEDGSRSVVESSSAALNTHSVRSALAPDPRWHPLEGLKIVDPEGQMVEGPFELLRPLALRLRVDQGSVLQAQDILRLYLWPLTAWDLTVVPKASCAIQEPSAKTQEKPTASSVRPDVGHFMCAAVCRAAGDCCWFSMVKVSFLLSICLCNALPMSFDLTTMSLRSVDHDSCKDREKDCGSLKQQLRDLQGRCRHPAAELCNMAASDL